MKGQEYCDCFPCSMDEVTDETLRHPKCDAIRFARAWEDGFSAGRDATRDALAQQAERHEREHRMLKAQLRHIVEKAAHIEALRPVVLKISTAIGEEDNDE